MTVSRRWLALALVVLAPVAVLVIYALRDLLWVAVLSVALALLAVVTARLSLSTGGEDTGMRTLDVWYAHLAEDELLTVIRRAARQVSEDRAAGQAAKGKNPAKGAKDAKDSRKLEKRGMKAAQQSAPVASSQPQGEGGTCRTPARAA